MANYSLVVATIQVNDNNLPNFKQESALYSINNCLKYFL
jgi:hypothetical protein